MAYSEFTTLAKVESELNLTLEENQNLFSTWADVTSSD